MQLDLEKLVLETFHRAAPRVPAYRTLLSEAGIKAEEIRTLNDFERLPVLDKASTFQRFDISQLCLDGQLGRLGTVLTSSGHSGIFAFGLTSSEDVPRAAEWIDDSLDALFSIRSKPTLLINCLPMGVKVPTQACTLAETSVRADMVIGLVEEFAHHFAQIILVGEAAFIKHVLELGRDAGIEWPRLTIQVIVGEEPLAENARKYLEGILSIDSREGNGGLIVSSMGVAEVGLNLFAEVPPKGALIALRRLLHANRPLRHRVLGPVEWVPCFFTYDPRRIYVEFDGAGRLLLTTLDPRSRVPLIRYATGDRGSFFQIPPELQNSIDAAQLPWSELEAIPIVMIHGRGEHALAGRIPVFPEAVKEGIYHSAELAALTTANFRLAGGAESAGVRIQLSPGIEPDADIERRFTEAISGYAGGRVTITCERYEDFGSGMSLDYERKFPYLKK
jgi:phenylacetate-CoA ligase